MLQCIVHCYSPGGLSTGLSVPVPLVLMKYSLSAFLLMLSTLSVTNDRDYVKEEEKEDEEEEEEEKEEEKLVT